MRHYLAIAGAVALAVVSVAATAQETAPAAATAFTPKVGQLVFSSDNKRLGRVDRVEATRIGLILEAQYVYIPLSTLSAGENNRVITKLTRHEVGH